MKTPISKAEIELPHQCIYACEIFVGNFESVFLRGLYIRSVNVFNVLLKGLLFATCGLWEIYI
jgi:hypothetical protein